MKISINVDGGSDDDKADLVSDLEEMGFECTTTTNLFESDELEFENAEADPSDNELNAELHGTVRQYFPGVNFKVIQ